MRIIEKIMKYFCLFLLVRFGIVTSVPQIFEENYEFCEYFINGEDLRVPGKSWKISNQQYTIQYNLCPYQVFKECKNATSCLIDNRSHQVFKLGTGFVPVESDDFILESINSDRCPFDTQNNYKLIINLICSNSIKLQPTLSIIDDCTFEINMMKPDCQPKCTGLIEDQYLLDLRQFPRNIPIITDNNRRFSIRICGINNQCGSRDISSCELLNNGNIPLAKTESQLINYDASKGELTARGKYKHNKITRDVQILIKCNWNSILTNITYKKVQIEGRHYKFELESSYGCVKLPQKCHLNSLDGYKYNLQQLYRPNNNWQVRNVPNGQLILNLCGPLRFNNRNQCSDQHSQICEIKSGKYTNLGSLIRYEIESYGTIKAIINHGNRCNDQQINLKSEILLKCSPIQQDPIYRNFANCTTFIEWSTPAACPIQYYEGDNCLVNDHYNPRNLQDLHQPIDRIFNINTNEKIIYNLCGPIHRNCSNYANVSFCLIQRNKEFVLAWDTRKLISDYGQLKLEMHGDLCPNRRDYGRILINFICDYNEPPPRMNIIQDSCKLNLTIYTKLACLSDGHFDKCSLSLDDGSCYDLTPLSLKNHNYIINDGDINYILNPCGPIVTNQKALCKGNSMLCLFNRTESHIRQQFKSIGGVIGPKFINNSLIIESIGDYCPGYGIYKSKIIFLCTNRDELPRLLKKEPCSYTFLWKTRYACVKNNCYIPNTSINLRDLKSTQLEIKLENSTINQFDLCEDVYKECNNGTCYDKELKQRTITIKEDIVYVELHLNNNCIKSNDFHTVIFKIFCDNEIINNDHFENESLEDCILVQRIYTQLICNLNNPTTVQQEIIEENTPHYYYTSFDCLIDRTDNNPINLHNLPGFNITSSNTKYTVNFDGSIQACFGLICMNDTVILPFPIDCPFTTRNDDDIHLQFPSGNLICQDNLNYNVDMVLKCGEEYNVQVVKNINCLIQFEYSIPTICRPVVSTNSSGIIGGVFGAVILLFALVVLFSKLRHKCCRQQQYFNLSALNLIYLKDCQE